MTSPEIVGSERYVSIATRRRNGTTVDTAVWIVDLGDGTVGFTTDVSAGKVKRIRNFPEVTLRPCDRRGIVDQGAPTWSGAATVLTGEAARPTVRAIRKKYGWQVVAIDVASWVRSLWTRRRAEDAAIVVTLDP
ncbi:MAG: PPOX class F420-dependent oxidoreductase [Ilumatobacteraceae bacterium]|nr:PPOX class F420-dependent oxidoreductase [Ilumatobacteraceae bacterium]